MHFSLLACASLIVSTLAAPSTNHVVHQKRDKPPPGWQEVEKLELTEVLHVRIALTQSNLDRTNEYLMQVSHPESDTYGQHWSAKQIAETFAPAQESVDVVITWLEVEGIQQGRVQRSQSLGWLYFDATVYEAQKLLKTEYYRYQHSSGKSHVGCTEYHVPEHVSPHIDFVTPSVVFDWKVARSKDDFARKIKRTKGLKAAIGVPVQPEIALDIGDPKSGNIPKKSEAEPLLNVSTSLNGLDICGSYITPDCLRALYDFPSGTTANPQNSFGIVEYTPQVYLQSDLDLFFANFSTDQVQRTPTLASIDGGVVGTTTTTAFNINAESDLDLEYAMTLVNPQKTTLYQVGDTVQGASFNDFLDAIDGSYCTFDGGDDPTQDAKYPDAKGGYQGPKNCGGFSATKVIATSYAYNEADLTARYEVRQCAEYAKLGLAGTTVLYATGDFGVAGSRGRCVDPVTKTFNGGANGLFNPSFPATCPYVTAIGATQINPNRTITDPEEAIARNMYSGGGFSNVFGLPAYQAEAVNSWFATSNQPYGADRFNNSRTSRAYPDLSANGANFVAAIDGAFAMVSGTSASTPVVGAIFTLINEARLNAGKSSIGFVNPVLYANSGDFNDITSGNNPGCGTSGFSAVRGWDPVTGLGTPNYPKLLETFLALN
ncbi:hypothetical protein MMC07_001502 [Pseudocyphellaria aurata]|nr:hypothetical protein [Pseudocyphellaria aurata]